MTEQRRLAVILVANVISYCLVFPRRANNEVYWSLPHAFGNDRIVALPGAAGGAEANGN
jgi:hypothetical protein